MTSIPIYKKRIGHSYLVWFQKSNLYFQLEEPAWFVFTKVRQRYKTETIANAFAYRYSTTFEESVGFVKEIRQNINRLNKPSTSAESAKEELNKQKNHVFSPYSVHLYKLGNSTVSFAYENESFEYYIHPLIGHLTTSMVDEHVHQFELFSCDESIVFRYNGDIKGSWKSDESHLVKGMIFMYLINVMYKKTEDDWLMTVHASAITNGKKTILFSAAPGNGKTTMAALLQTRGFKMISDDFVPFDRERQYAYPFPIAMSVKEGAMKILAKHFPELKNIEATTISPEKTVRYLAGEKQNVSVDDIFPVNEFVFIKYDPSVDFNFEKLEPIPGLKQLLDQTWVPPNKENARILFDKILYKSFYQLSYSNNEIALDAITKLFEND